ncbi:exonuclease sbcCD subunit D [Sphingobacteriales bacterium UPWRP_1]|nr:hypothetical protein B6N25_14075 [Sphingobacteriales bacterium TSM_CSS]PSJ76737.1 exonuclease sbcCD subunit D [Sphingobacteriales bacterium UPWRP_1]
MYSVHLRAVFEAVKIILNINFMRILHTADWHLGQKLCDRDRKEEHDLFLQWLLDTLENRQPDALIVAGDVFDVGYPPKYAETQYYNVIKDACRLCPNIIITGGNHDSPNALNAPRQLLKAFNVHVIGGAMQQPEDEIVPVVNRKGTVIGYVAAVPYLREGDVRIQQAGENYIDRIASYKEGIRRHYRQIANALLPAKEQGLPIVATAHLYAAGSATSDPEDREMHIIGNQGQMEVEIFPAEFDYVALGHIHKPQLVSGKEHVRYSGSPIPLSFSERNDAKQVLLADFTPHKGLQHIHSLQVPLYRHLHRFKGSFETVKNQLQHFTQTALLQPCWAEIHLTLANFEFGYEEPIKEAAKAADVDILKFPNPKYLAAAASDDLPGGEPADMELLQNYLQVFREKCKAAKIADTDMPELEHTFTELTEIMNLYNS